jgi:hypothetical protein
MPDRATTWRSQLNLQGTRSQMSFTPCWCTNTGSCWKFESAFGSDAHARLKGLLLPWKAMLVAYAHARSRMVRKYGVSRQRDKLPPGQLKLTAERSVDYCVAPIGGLCLCRPPEINVCRKQHRWAFARPAASKNNWPRIL